MWDQACGTIRALAACYSAKQYESQHGEGDRIREKPEKFDMTSASLDRSRGVALIYINRRRSNSRCYDKRVCMKKFEFRDKEQRFPLKAKRSVENI
jgi:hypothetical protein